MKRHPIELPCRAEYCRVCPKEKRWLALYGVNVRPASVDDLIRHDGIHSFTVNWLRMHKGREANRDGQQNDPERGPLEPSQAMTLHIHHWYCDRSSRHLPLLDCQNPR